MFDHSMLPMTPGAIIGYRKSGQPIRLIAGGASEDGGEGQPQETGAQQGDPEAEVTPPAPEQEPVNPDAIKVDQLPSWAQKLIRETRNEAAEFRNQLRDAQRTADEAAKAKGPSADEITKQVQSDLAQQIGRALGLIGEDQKELTPEQVIEQLTAEKDTTAKERDAEKERHRRALIELAVHRSGSKMGADADALLDSRSFLKKIRDLDINADDFATGLGEVIQLALDENPKYKAAALSGPPARSGGEFAGGPGGRMPSSEPSIDDFRKKRGKSSS